MPDRFLEADIAALEKLIAVDSDEEILVDVRVQKEDELCEARTTLRGIYFHLGNFSEVECVEKFRMAKADLPVLATKLHLPDEMEFGRVCWTGLEGLCLVLARLSVPNRRFDLEKTFGRGTSQLSVVFNSTLDFLFMTWRHLFSDLGQHTGTWLTVEKLAEGCDAVARKCPMQNVFGFLDGTARRIYRPAVNQRLWYSGHKRRHVMKFQAVMLPCGICVHLYGPFEGRRHDSAMLHASNLLQDVAQHIPQVNGRPRYILYGDKGYPVEPAILAPFRGNNLNPGERWFNRQMTSVRICVEWGFAGITSQFSLLTMWKRMRIGLQPVGQYYIVATLLYNCMTCLYENETSMYFEVKPPTLDEYLQ